jgi:hypothetical protein
MKELESAIRYIKNAQELSRHVSLQKEAEEKLDKAIEKIREHISNHPDTEC